MNNEENKQFDELGKILSGEQPSTPEGVNKELSDIWNLAGNYQYAESKSTEAGWNDLKNRISKEQPLRVSWIRRNQFAVAASVALAVCAGGLAWFGLRNNEALTKALYVQTGSNEIKTISLEDGSTITLNSNSEITVKEGFNQNGRQITLVGQASFEVAKNEELPFEVQAGVTKTKVLGTGFDILAYPNEQVRILVKHGKVNFGSAKEHLILVKGQGGVFEPQTGKVALYSGDTANMEWQNGVWVFKKARLSDIATMFKHRYGKSLKYSSVHGERLFTGRFESGASAEQIANTLKEALQIEVTIE